MNDPVGQKPERIRDPPELFRRQNQLLGRQHLRESRLVRLFRVERSREIKKTCTWLWQVRKKNKRPWQLRLAGMDSLLHFQESRRTEEVMLDSYLRWAKNTVLYVSYKISEMLIYWASSGNKWQAAALCVRVLFKPIWFNSSEDQLKQIIYWQVYPFNVTSGTSNISKVKQWEPIPAEQLIILDLNFSSSQIWTQDSWATSDGEKCH